MGRAISVRYGLAAALGAVAISITLTGAAMEGHDPAAATAVAAEVHHHTSVDRAPDPDAPAGAPLYWLPQESWVLEHWLPFDHRRLLARLEVDVAGLIEWVRDDVHTLAQLAESKGQDPRQLADHLVKPWRGQVSSRRYAVLRKRTMRFLSQSHLAHHFLGHPFHQRSIQRRAQEIYGADRREIAELRKQGLSFVDIAQRHGRSATQIYDAAMAILRESADTAVRRHDTSRAWRRYWLSLQAERLGRYQAARPGKGHHEDR